MSISQASAAKSSAQDKALVYLSDVVQLDLNSYEVTLKQTNQVTTSNVNDRSRTHLVYSLDSETSGLLAEFIFCDEKLEVCTIIPKTGIAAYSKQQPDSVLDSAKAFVERHKQFSNLAHFVTVDSMISNVQTLEPGMQTRTDENLVLKTIVDGNFTTFTWAQKIGGVESNSSKVTVMFTGQDLMFFQDAWGLSQVNYYEDSSLGALASTNVDIPSDSDLPQKAVSIVSNVIGIDT